MLSKLLNHPIAQLMRVHSLTGGYLLLAPTLTAYILACINYSAPVNLSWVVFFIVGAFSTRFMGCAINDYWDRDIDKKVVRTANRPLASNRMTVTTALLVILLLAIFNFCLMLLLPLPAIYLCLLAAVLIVLYPLAKRLVNMPQIVLAVVFSMGIPIAWQTAAATNGFQSSVFESIWLFCANFLWIVYYDTIYALADLDDDAKLSIGSTAKYFGKYKKIILALLSIACVSCYLVLAYDLNLHFIWLIWCCFTAIFFAIQIIQIDRVPPIKLFHQNGKLGLIMVLIAVLCIPHLDTLNV